MLWEVGNPSSSDKGQKFDRKGVLTEGPRLTGFFHPDSRPTPRNAPHQTEIVGGVGAGNRHEQGLQDERSRSSSPPPTLQVIASFCRDVGGTQRPGNGRTAWGNQRLHRITYHWWLMPSAAESASGLFCRNRAPRRPAIAWSRPRVACLVGVPAIRPEPCSPQSQTQPPCRKWVDDLVTREEWLRTHPE